MVAEPGPREIRREKIRQRLSASRVRIKELRAWRAENAGRATPERLAAAQQRMAASRAAAERAFAASAQAFRFSAEAHERAARQHERAAAAGTGEADQHGKQAAAHRAAATADIRQAERMQLMLGGEVAGIDRGPEADQV